MELKSDYLFVVDVEARLDDAQTLRELLKQNRYARMTYWDCK